MLGVHGVPLGGLTDLGLSRAIRTQRAATVILMSRSRVNRRFVIVAVLVGIGVMIFCWVELTSSGTSGRIPSVAFSKQSEKGLFQIHHP